MNKLEIFIAGSKELKEERALVRTVASNLTAEYHRKGKEMHYAIYDYTNFDFVFATDGQQTNYNKYIANNADLVIFILTTGIGKKTHEEFKVALNAYDTNKHPAICVFSNTNARADATINDIRQEVSRLNQYYTDYETNEQLEARVYKLLRDCSDPIIEKSNRRKTLKTILGVVVVAVVAVLGILAYAFNSGLKVADAEQTPSVQPQTEKVVAPAEKKPATTQKQTSKAVQPTTKTKTPVVAAKPVETAKPATTSKPATTAQPVASAPAPKPSLQSKAEADNGDIGASYILYKQSKAEAGDAESCYELALRLQSGVGVARDLDAAFKYMKMAAEGGYTPAYISLAEMYHKGEGVSKNRDNAEVWYRRAADNGDRRALYILNNM